MPADSPPVTIRPAAPADVDLMVEHTWAVAAEGRWLGTEVPFDRAERARRLGQTIAGPGSAAFVADASAVGDQPVVGFATVHLAPYGVADLGMLIVEAWRGRGVGSRLLGAAIGWAREAGAHKMALEVWPHNQAGRRLYERFGFVEEGRKVRHYRGATARSGTPCSWASRWSDRHRPHLHHGRLRDGPYTWAKRSSGRSAPGP